MLKKKYPAQRITVFAIYRKFMLLGNYGRVFVVAVPERKDAEKWIAEKIAKDPFYRESDFMIEEFSGWMKSWQP